MTRRGYKAKRPLISIIVPVFNAENSIDHCILSIRRQTIEDWELLLINDGSTDSSGIICDNWMEEEDRIRVFHCQKAGTAASRNRGIDKAKGRYLTFIDADDTIAPDFLEYLYGLIIREDAEISVCNYENIYPGDEVLRKAQEEVLVTESGRDAMESLLYQRYFVSSPWAKLYNARIWERLRFPEGTLSEDFPTIVKVLPLADKVTYSSVKKYDYYHRKGSSIDRLFEKRNRDYFRHSRELIDFVKENYPECISAAYSRHLSTCYHIYAELPLGNSEHEFTKVLKQDIGKVREYVMKDPRASKRNRIAAFFSGFSVEAIHFIVRIQHKLEKRRLK
ncbi:MAG: glycosyltransferase [Deltaproteobacteria bacterium]|nr:glycosyltransferase [Deltaproteobacteria bacterium]